MEDLENLAKAQDAIEANDLKQWDINFWGERLRELKYDINEVHLSLSPSLSLYVPTHTHTHTHTHTCTYTYSFCEKHMYAMKYKEG